MTTAVAQLLSILDLETLEQNLFRGSSPQDGWQRVFGGQVIGQALVAAERTVDGRNAHSLHAYFLRPGDPTVPIIYEVDRIRDGRSFATRSVRGVQHGQAIFAMSASFHGDEPGLEHQIDMGEVPDPDSLESIGDLVERVPNPADPVVRAYFRRARPIEIRPTDVRHYLGSEPLPPRQVVWVRTTERLPDDPAMHRCALAYASDMTLLDTSLFPHGRTVFDRSMMLASLDHAMWFHRPFRADEWLLYAQDSPAAVGARGFNRGLIYDRAGRLVASVAQEGLMRERRAVAGREGEDKV
jgi:acyl-CoA thioesterase-2